MLLLRVASDIRERQDHDREARRRGFFGPWVRGGLCLGGRADVKRIDPDRLGDILELGRAEIVDFERGRQLRTPIERISALASLDLDILAGDLQTLGLSEALSVTRRPATPSRSPSPPIPRERFSRR